MGGLATGMAGGAVVRGAAAAGGGGPLSIVSFASDEDAGNVTSNSFTLAYDASIDIIVTAIGNNGSDGAYTIATCEGAGMTELSQDEIQNRPIRWAYILAADIPSSPGASWDIVWNYATRTQKSFMGAWGLTNAGQVAPAKSYAGGVGNPTTTIAVLEGDYQLGLCIAGNDAYTPGGDGTWDIAAASPATGDHKLVEQDAAATGDNTTFDLTPNRTLSSVGMMNIPAPV